MYLKIPSTVFLHIPFLNIKKGTLMIAKIPGTDFLPITFYKYYKKHTYESQNI